MEANVPVIGPYLFRTSFPNSSRHQRAQRARERAPRNACKRVEGGARADNAPTSETFRAISLGSLRSILTRRNNTRRHAVDELTKLTQRVPIKSVATTVSIANVT